MSGTPELGSLDDLAALEAGDPGEMLRAIASSPAQVREAATLAGEAGLERLAEEGRPRAVVVLGMGGSAVAGDVLAAVAGPTSPVQVVVHRGYDLPGWVGPADLVIAVSCSGSTEETLSSAEEAVRRGCRMLVVGGAGSPVHTLAEQARAPFVPVPQGRQPRASIWALSTPLVLAGAQLGIVTAPPEVVEATAARLESLSDRCRPSSDTLVNPAKALAGELAGTLPMVWGTSHLSGVAAYRFICQLAENAKSPAVPGLLPEANHNQVVCLDGPYGSGPFGSSPAARSAGGDDFFRDRGDDGEEPAGRLRLVLLRDAASEEHPQVARRAEVSKELAAARGVPVTELVAEGASSFERLASLVGLPDYASAYLALRLGLDPTPVTAITELKGRIKQ